MIRCWKGCLVAALLLLFTQACRDPDNIGDGLLPGAEVFFTDTISMELFTVQQDCVQTDDPALFLFGELNDPYLGRSTAGFATQFLPASNGIVFADDAVVDSVILQLYVATKYGNSDAPHVLQVYRLAQGFEEGRVYYSNDSIPVLPVDYADGRGFDFPDTFASQTVQIQLNNSLGEYLLAASETDMASADAFATYLPGLYITSTCPSNPNDGAIFVANMLTVNSFVRLKYHEPSDTGNIYRSVDYVVSIDSRGMNQFRRVNTQGLLITTEPAKPASQQERLILQGGTNTRIVGQINPAGLAQLGRVAINRAELVFTLDPDYGGTFDDFYPELNGIFMYAREAGTDREDSTSFRIDLSSSVNENANQFTVDLTAYVQDIITNRRANTGLVAVPPVRNISFQRSIVAGTAHPTAALRPRLRIHYSELPE